MTCTERYFAHITELLNRLLITQQKNIRLLAEKVFETSQNGGRLFVFGCSHAGMLAEESFYRTGGLVTMNPVLPKGLTLNTVPVTDTTVLERDLNYAHTILDDYGLKAGDLLIIHSVSGRNGVPVEMAVEAHRRNIFTAGITSVHASAESKSRHPSGKHLFELCDLVIDNCGVKGDAALQIDGFAGKTAATSTIAGAAIINSVCAEVVEMHVKNGIAPPVFMSANVDGGDEYNEKMLKKYSDVITYM